MERLKLVSDETLYEVKTEPISSFLRNARRISHTWKHDVIFPFQNLLTSFFFIPIYALSPVSAPYCWSSPVTWDVRVCVENSPWIPHLWSFNIPADARIYGHTIQNYCRQKETNTDNPEVREWEKLLVTFGGVFKHLHAQR